jgi:phage gp45-like
MRKIWSKLQTTIMRGIVDRSTDDKKISSVQVEWAADRTSANVEYKQPQGLYFRPAEKAEGLLLAVAGDHSSAVLIDAQSRTDSPGGGGVSAGEGGLYYAGEFKVFLDKNGLVHLGEQTGSDFVALAAKVKSDLDGIKSDLDAIKLNLGAAGHIHTCAAPGSPSSPPTIPLVLTYTPSSPAATKVKAS